MKSPGSCWMLCSLVTSFTAFALAITIIASILFSCFPDSLASLIQRGTVKESYMPPLLFSTKHLGKGDDVGLAEILKTGESRGLVRKEDDGGLAEIVHLEEELEQLETKVEAVAVQRPRHQKLLGKRPLRIEDRRVDGVETEGVEGNNGCVMVKFHGVRLVCKKRKKAHR